MYIFIYVYVYICLNISTHTYAQWRPSLLRRRHFPSHQTRPDILHLPSSFTAGLVFIFVHEARLWIAKVYGFLSNVQCLAHTGDCSFVNDFLSYTFFFSLFSLIKILVIDSVSFLRPIDLTKFYILFVFFRVCFCLYIYVCFFRALIEMFEQCFWCMWFV